MIRSRTPKIGKQMNGLWKSFFKFRLFISFVFISVFVFSFFG